MLRQEPKRNEPSLSQPHSNPQKHRKKWLWVGFSLSGLALGGATSVLLWISPWGKLPFLNPTGNGSSQSLITAEQQQSELLKLALATPADRATPLEKLAQTGSGIDRSRARYLLAVDRIQQDHGGAALPLLEGLETEYPVLAAQILAKRAQAYAATGDQAKATATWNQLLQQYGDNPASAEALFNLGKTNPKYWDQLLAKFPGHPHSIDVAVARLQKDPKQPELLLLLAKHGLYLPDIVSVLDRLKTEYAAQLKPEDWQAIAFGYWEKQKYGSAGDAYAKAPPTALNLYRAGRGAQLDGKTETAINRYESLIQAFPEAKETGLAMMRLVSLVEKPETAIAYLEQVMTRFPDRAPEAMMAKADRLLEQNQAQAALKIQQGILAQYSHSEEAATIRWQQVEEHLKNGNTQSAWEWARQLAAENPDSELAPQAAFWVGRWAADLGKPDAAKQSYEYVLATYPESYYAWRSAVLLGWDVGDFSTVRQKLPQVVKPTWQPEPLAGSEAAKELYRLGQDRDAWDLWQVEFTNRVEPTVAEQFTDGLMRLGVNDNLDGLFMLSSLDLREQPEERQQVKQIKQDINYWYALYAFPYSETIEQWAQQRQLNPMLVTALIRQESRFEAKIESIAGAKGLMQVMPDTADWVAGQAGLKQYNLETPNDNVNLGTWYLDFTHREYNNNSMYAVASYNAGPGSVADWINQFGTIDPDQFVEKIPFGETKGYVKSVFGNYWNYLRLYNPDISKQLAQSSEHHAELVK